MAKRKPKEFPSLVPRKPEDWILGVLFYAARTYEAGLGIRRFTCSNPDCGKETVINARNTWIPSGCMYCGDEFDWEGILTEKAKICTRCQTRYPLIANFCVFHGKDMIPLNELEYRK